MDTPARGGDIPVHYAVPYVYGNSSRGDNKFASYGIAASGDTAWKSRAELDAKFDALRIQEKHIVK